MSLHGLNCFRSRSHYRYQVSNLPVDSRTDDCFTCIPTSKYLSELSTQRLNFPRLNSGLIWGWI